MDTGPTVLTVHEENAMGLVWSLGDKNVEVCNGGDVQYRTPKEVSQLEMSIPRTRLLVPLLTQHTKAGTRRQHWKDWVHLRSANSQPGATLRQT